MWTLICGKVSLMHRLTFRNDQSHLISPVSQMDISKNIMSHFSCNSFYALTNNCRTKMSYMKRFCHVRSHRRKYHGYHNHCRECGRYQNRHAVCRCRLRRHRLLQVHQKTGQVPILFPPWFPVQYEEVCLLSRLH